MRGVNKVIILGNLGADPEYHQFNDGGAIANISVATSEQWNDRQTGERREKTEWHRISLSNRGNYKMADIANQYLRKGSKVYIEGSLHTRKYQDQNGQDRYITEIRADNLQMLDSPNSSNAGMGNPQTYNQQGGYPNSNHFQDQGGYPNQNSQPNNYSNQYNQPNQGNQQNSLQNGNPAEHQNNPNTNQNHGGDYQNNFKNNPPTQTPNIAPDITQSSTQTNEQNLGQVHGQINQANTPNNGMAMQDGPADEDIPF